MLNGVCRVSEPSGLFLSRFSRSFTLNSSRMFLIGNTFSIISPTGLRLRFRMRCANCVCGLSHDCTDNRTSLSIS